MVQYHDSDSDNYITVFDYKESVDVLNQQQHANKVYAKLSVNNIEEHFQLDSGATVNVISDTTFGTLVTYNHSEIKPVGQVTLNVTNPKNNKSYEIEFVIVPGQCKSILGLSTCQKMALLTVNHHNISSITTTPSDQPKPAMSLETVLSEYAEVFLGESKLEGDLHLQLDESVPAVQLPPRRVPLAVKDKLKAELERLSEKEIITAVDEPTEWISALVVTTKRSGGIRLCIDPKPLNNALKRNHYPLPTIDDVLPMLADARVFTVLDAKNGFWHIQLDEPSSYLTTFGTPWGRYRWLRMPFGLSPAPEEFQRRIDIALEGLEGAKAIADDILVFGTGKTDGIAERNHDDRLKAVLERCQLKGIKLNKQKIQFKQSQVQYIITAEGLQPDPSKIEAIVHMPTPTDREGMQRLLGMTNYVQRFAPSLAETTKPLRDLLKKDNAFFWDDQHNQSLQEVKKMLTQAPVLKYFDPSKQTTLQCDASKDGLGVCLLQEGHPVAYASRALTPTETQYAQIEKELLAVVYGVEKFSEYVYGRPVTIETDHKPLESIMKKSLLSAPKRLQRMLLRLQRYDLHVVYKKGTEMYLADTLSRAYLEKAERNNVNDGSEVLAVDDFRSKTEQEAEHIDMIKFLPLRDPTIQDIKNHTEADPDLQALAALIMAREKGENTTTTAPLSYISR